MYNKCHWKTELNENLYDYIWHTISKITKEPKQKRRLGTASNKNWEGGFNLFAVDQPSPLVLPWFLRHLVVRFACKIPNS